MSTVSKKSRLWIPDACLWPYRYTGDESQRVDVVGLCNLALDCGVAVEMIPSAEVRYVRSRGLGILTHLPELSTGAPGYRTGLCNSKAEVEGVVLPAYERGIQIAAPGERLVVFAGVLDKERPDDESRLIGYLQGLAKKAEAAGVTLVLEHLCNKGDGPDDMKGHTRYRGWDLDWVAGVVRKVGSKFVRLLLDAYHVEIMHPGMLIALLRKHFDVLGHVHVAGVVGGKPSRVELDVAGQQIDFLAFANELTELGWTGGVGFEYLCTPGRNVRDGLMKSKAMLGLAA